MFRAIVAIVKVLIVYGIMGIAMWYAINWSADFSIYLNNFMHPALSLILGCILACIGAGGSVVLGFGLGAFVFFREED